MLRKNISIILVSIMILTVLNPIICFAINNLNISISLKIDDIIANTNTTNDMYYDSQIYISASSNYLVKKIIYYWDEYKEYEINSNSGNIVIPEYLTTNSNHKLNIIIVSNDSNQTQSDVYTYNMYYSLSNNVNRLNVNAKINDTNIYEDGYYSILPDSKIYINGTNTGSGYIMQYSWNDEKYVNISNYKQELNVLSTLEVNKWHTLNIKVYNSSNTYNKIYTYNVYLSKDMNEELPVISFFADNKVLKENENNYINSISNLKIVGTHNNSIKKIQYKINNGAYVTSLTNPTNILINNTLYNDKENYIYIKAISNDSNQRMSKEYKYKIYINNPEIYQKPNIKLDIIGDGYILNNSYYTKYDSKINIKAVNTTNFTSIIYNWNSLENVETSLNNININVPSSLEKNEWHTLNIKLKNNVNNKTIERTFSYNIYVYEQTAPQLNFDLNIQFNGSTASNNQKIIANANSYFDISSQNNSISKIVYRWNNEDEKIVNTSNARINIPSSLKYNGWNSLEIYAYTNNINNQTVKSKIYEYNVYYTNTTYINPEFKAYINDNSISSYNTLPYIVRSDDKIKIKGYGDFELTKIEYRWNDESTRTIYSNDATISKPKDILSTNTLLVRTYINGNCTSWYTYYINFNDYTNINTDVYSLMYQYGERFNNNIDVTRPYISLRNITGANNNKMNFLLNEEIMYNLDVYIPYSYIRYNDLNITFTIPSNIKVTFLNNCNGVINGNKITWKIDNVSSDIKMTLPIKLKYTSMSSSNMLIMPSASINLNNYETAESKVIDKIYKNTSTLNYIQHTPYMYGDANSNLFRPYDNITRAELCSILVRAFNLNQNTRYSNFNDIDEISNKYNWAKKDILTCYNLGIVRGYDDGSFKPGNNVTKAELITILSRILNTRYSGLVGLEKEPLKIFNNINNASIKENSWYINNVSELIRLNIVKIDNINTYMTLDLPINRAEVTNILNSVLLRAQISNINSTLINKFTDVNTYTNYCNDILEATADSHYFKIDNNGYENIQ